MTEATEGRAEGGAPVRLSRAATYLAFMAWLGRVLDPATPALATPARLRA
ncbi:hypothetical protein ACVGVM_09755 [Pseudonocardia bannensis]|uniref:Uncharacterized protein n=1 Tax=Pseudonocardia bannensis TaxID=630973 RepID=A0A848DS01_9PSEU|nr:hypothetical protein [Pseudonocardia bannensis]NMH95269.1 hypothetical protein [Pseudonocardia bannensis]